MLAVEAGEAFVAPSRRLRAAAIAAFTFDGLLGLVALLAVRRAVRAAARAQEAYGRAERSGLAARLAATVAHEVRNPLGIIRACAELLRERLGGASPPRPPSQVAGDRELLDDLLEEVQRLNRITDDFLDLARDPPLRRAEVDLAALAAEACARLRLRFPAIEVTADTPSACVAFADEARLRQVLDNLLLNAAQATAGRGAVRVAAARDERGVRIAVADDGPGVAPEIADRLFEPFATGRSTGTGLGLALARRILEMHGGRIELRPSPRGACFELWLPATAP